MWNARCRRRKRQGSQAGPALGVIPHTSASASGPGRTSPGARCVRLARSHLRFLAWQLSKGASWDPALDRGCEGGSSPAWEVSHRLCLASCLKLHQLQTKRFQTQRKARPAQCRGPAWHLNSAIRVLGAQTGHAVLDALLPPRPECQEPAMGLWGPLPLLLTRGPN